MKRHNGLFEKIVSLENLRIADQKARRGKRTQRAVISHIEHEESNLLDLQHQLISGTFKTSKYTTFSVFEPKERIVYRLPYFPDRIVHHAIMNVLEPILVGVMPRDTYSCIRGRGLHMAARNVRKSLKDVPNTTYCLKMDIRKFYPSINHSILKDLLNQG
jgi:retron-type reverse transcriptase